MSISSISAKALNQHVLLHFAAMWGHVEVVLLPSGAMLLHVALNGRNTEVYNFLFFFLFFCDYACVGTCSLRPPAVTLNSSRRELKHIICVEASACMLLLRPERAS